jgi:hydroxymethylpyrimidine/phosphomethylpyrimidine kinase
VRDAQEYTWQTLKAGFRPGMGQFVPDRLFWARETDEDAPADADADADAASSDDAGATDASPDDGIGGLPPARATAH